MNNAPEHIAPALTLRVGGVRARFEALSDGLRFRVRFPRTRFLTDSDAVADSVVRVRFGEPAPGTSLPWFSSGGTWEVHRGSLGGDRVVFYTALDDGGRAAMMRLDFLPDLSIGDMVLDPIYAQQGILEIGFPLDEYITARLLVRRNAVVVHAASIAEDNEVFVFIGHSGAGKSTISGIAEQAGLTVLSDDRTVLNLKDGTVLASGTPWHGSQKSGRPDVLPVRAIFLLEQAAEDEAVPLDMSKAFAELIVRTVRPLADVAEQLMVVDTLESMVRQVPFGVLRFRPTRAVLDTVRGFVTPELVRRIAPAFTT